MKELKDTKTKKLSIPVTEDFYKKISSIAASKGVPLAGLVRGILKNYSAIYSKGTHDDR